jgi:hypothetical protein
VDESGIHTRSAGGFPASGTRQTARGRRGLGCYDLAGTRPVRALTFGGGDGSRRSGVCRRLLAFRSVGASIARSVNPQTRPGMVQDLLSKWTNCPFMFPDKLDNELAAPSKLAPVSGAARAVREAHYFLGSTAGILAVLRGSRIPRRRRRRLLEARCASVGTR